MDYRVIKENDLFLLTDFSGDITTDHSVTNEIQGWGLYRKDTRFLSRLELKLNGEKPIVLASEADQNYFSQILLTNPHMEQDGVLNLWRESIELERSRFIYKNVLYETLKTTNYNPDSTAIDVSMRFDADFHDMFIVRGYAGATSGEKSGFEQFENGFTVRYTGSDQVRRQTKISWSAPAHRIDEEGTVHFRLSMDAGESKTIEFNIIPIIGDEQPESYPQHYALEQLRNSYMEWENSSTAVESDLPLFNSLYAQGLKDIRVLLTDLGFGKFPVAGVPWFAVPFGRDSLITALQLLPIHPEIARGTLLTMAEFQGTEVDEWRDEQPGKIMHELRSGELANTNQIPFTPYYGTIDATPLFLVLIGEYVKWTDDREFFIQMLPHIERALDWIDQYGDSDGNHFVEYWQKSSQGLSNQGWKDSGNSIVHRNGQFAEAPIALVEVQGYVYQAKRSIANFLHKLSTDDYFTDAQAWAKKLEDEAALLRDRFEAEFWIEDQQYYALALDREQKQVQSITSNPGHLLMSGMLQPARAAAVAEKLLSTDLFSGYGIRTMAVTEKGYNPMSYHNGSIWPHDNSLSLIGLSKLGYDRQAKQLIEGLLQSAQHFENSRLPELFCGYPETLGKPVRYPVACSPQAWAAGTALVIAEAMIGMQLDEVTRTVHIRPVLPAGMNELHVRRLKIGTGQLELIIRRPKEQDSGYKIEVISNTTDWQMDY